MASAGILRCCNGAPPPETNNTPIHTNAAPPALVSSSLACPDPELVLPGYPRFPPLPPKPPQAPQAPQANLPIPHVAEAWLLSTRPQRSLGPRDPCAGCTGTNGCASEVAAKASSGAFLRLVARKVPTKLVP
ncbi:hypothetical protein VDGL01_09009 [Verticillium dahliae]